jgi:hypothetical protein
MAMLQGSISAGCHMVSLPGGKAPSYWTVRQCQQLPACRSYYTLTATLDTCSPLLASTSHPGPAVVIM